VVAGDAIHLVGDEMTQSGSMAEEFINHFNGSKESRDESPRA